MSIQSRYATILDRIANAAKAAGRSPKEITLVAVSKTWPAGTVLEAYAAGMRHFGENRVEELAPKRAEVEAALGPGNGITWHLIGPLQSRKTRLAAEHADIFHALDRLKIARRLSQHLEEANRPSLPVFIEVNISGEATKTGFDLTRWETDAAQLQAFTTTLATIRALPRIEVSGLMTMAPWDAPPADIQHIFHRTRELARRLDLPLLSMGMTDDFELAIAEGATHVRIGRAIFGERATG